MATARSTSTEASERTSRRRGEEEEGRLSEYRVLCGTDGDAAEILTDVLTNTDSDGVVFCLGHNCYSYNIGDGEVLLTLCLPAKRPWGADKCLPVIQFRCEAARAAAFLFQGRPIQVRYIQKNINHKAVKRYFKPLLSVLTCANKKAAGGGGGEGAHADLKSTIFWFRAKFVAAVRKTFKITASPYWMISTFGCTEAQFVLVSCCYFFESHECTVDTLSHLSRLFDGSGGGGRQLAAVNTFSDLSGMLGTSAWLGRVPEFSAYVAKKLARDDFESGAVDEAVNAFRGQLMLSNTDLIHYIYLSFFQCLNKERFLEYSLKTNPENIDGVAGIGPIITGFIDEGFRRKMATYYTKESYLSNHIAVGSMSLEGVEGYSEEAVGIVEEGAAQSAAPNIPGVGGRAAAVTRYWAGQSRDVQSLLSDLLSERPASRLSPDLHGLLDLAALGDGSAAEGAKEVLFPDPVRCPVYRCQYLNKTFFAVVRGDNLGREWWARHVHLPQYPGWESAEDRRLTAQVHYTELAFSLNHIREQLGVSRHEYFNPRLPVFNLVLDFDLPLRAPSGGLGLDRVYSICRSVRGDVLGVLGILGEVDEAAHPVYFFKSACPPPQWYGGEEEELLLLYGRHATRPFCRCDAKLGLRIITPLPAGTAIVGGGPLIAIAKILNRMIKMNREDLLEICPDLPDAEGPLDTGIYHRGRCVRLPHTYKVNEAGGLERLLKLFVCHPGEGDKGRYVRDALTLKNLLHHSKSDYWERVTAAAAGGRDGAPQKIKVVYSVTDVSEDFLVRQTQQQLPRSYEKPDDRIEAVTGRDLVTWVNEVAWPKVFHNIKAYIPDDKTTQFHFVKFTQTSHNIVQVKPQRGNNFLCISSNHRNKTQSVRIFIVLYTNKEEEVTVTLMSQCFAHKCNSNKPRAHFSIPVQLRGREALK
nr:helicase-primase primase subunit [Equid gammaherpesvirus 5]UTK45540.1 helicase-primase primase subunit [Equid gammaherpesvirus 5]UTK45619.1 helicase-primase primase subunit [Equid gammaherpesvirus 5]UTK45698.1 helicase-primase primase subunit [Equid gammaherpesvirus 5]